MSEDIIIPLSAEHVRMLGGSDEHIARVQAEEDAAKATKEPEVVPEVETNTEVKPEAKPEDTKVSAPSEAEKPAATKEPADNKSPEPDVKGYDAVLGAINTALSHITDPEEKAIVDEQLAKVIDEKYDTYKNLPMEEMAEALASRAEKIARKIIEEKRAAKAKEAALAVKTEEAQKNLKEVNTFISPGATRPSQADADKELQKRAEQGDEEAISELFTRRRTYTIED